MMRYKTRATAHVLLAVDPGRRKLGLAMGVVDPRAGSSMLVAVTTLICTAEPGVDLNHAAASGVWSWAKRQQAEHGLHDLPLVWVAEELVKYPNKPLYHASIDMGIATMTALGAIQKPAKTWPPRVWKGTIEKRVHHPRIRRALTPEERVLMPSFDQHDTWDAVGIFLFATDRLRRGGAQ